jgi:pyoverdine/dityrosine biosynthesis protein Dit1
MSAQLYILNQTKCKLILKVHKPHTLKWVVEGHRWYSLALPVDADCITKYKIKSGGHLIAEIRLDHTGHIVAIKNCDKMLCVMTDVVEHYRGREVNKEHHLCHGQPTIYITRRVC